MTSEPFDPRVPVPRSFATTQWSLVLCAGKGGETESAQHALAELCERYWYPVYAYVRRSVPDVSTAQDRTQSFFVHLLEKRTVEHATPERGRFRNFLLKAVQHFLINEYQHGQALKRGGGIRPLSLDWEAGESQWSIAASHNVTAEKLFDRQWALLILQRALDRLRDDYESTGRGALYRELQGSLTGEESVAAANETPPPATDAARQALRRMRKRYRELLRDEVGQTLDSAGDIDDEIRRLFAILAE